MNRIHHGEIDPAVLENLRTGLAYSSYNAIPSILRQAGLADDQARVDLLAVPRVFQDTLLAIGPEMVKISGGCFQMGSPETEPERLNDEIQHRVCVEDFMLGRYEVTFAEYDAFAQASGREKPDDEGWGRGRRPVINVSWNDALAYAQWLSAQTGETYRLPTEAQWEYATRAGSETAFWWGDSITTDQANYNGSFRYNNGPKGEFRGKTLEVGSFETNAFGLFDVHGNVWEWTCPVYDTEYGGAEQRCADADEEGRRVLRGGSWTSGPGGLRSANRFYIVAMWRIVDVGFRLARAVP